MLWEAFRENVVGDGSAVSQEGFDVVDEMGGEDESLKGIEDSVFGSCKNVFAFRHRSGDKSGAGKIAQVFGVGANRIVDLGSYEFVGRLYTKTGEATQPFDISSLAELPPRRDFEDVVEMGFRDR